MATLPDTARDLIESGPLAHLVTVNPDGSPHVTIVWVGVDGDEIVSGHLADHHKLHNIRRDPRVALSVEGESTNAVGMQHYLVIEGRARITEGGAPDLLQELAHVYVAPDARFPPMDDPPPGFVLHITVGKVGGIGPWNPGSFA